MTDKVLLIDDDRQVRDALGQSLELADLRPILCGSFIEAKDHINSQFSGVIVTDIRMPGRDGFHVLQHAQAIDPELPVILLTGEADVPMAVKAMGQGAHAFLEKPCAPTTLLSAIEQAMQQRLAVLTARDDKLKHESGDVAARMLIGVSPQAEELRQRARSVGRTTAEVLITGAPGSGTSKVAEVIHLLSPVARHPFVKRSAGAMDVTTLQTALGAAKTGSLFIDEVGKLPAATQFALLDTLESGTPVRILAGTTTMLDDVVASGAFSAELFYRLDQMQVRIPALRERPGDIPVMFQRYVSQACEQAGLAEPEITSDVLAQIMAQNWPGNARSLMSAAMRFALRLGDGAQTQGLGLAEQLAQVERSLLIAALQRHKGHATKTAAALKLPRKTFYDKLTRHGLMTEDYRR